MSSPGLVGAETTGDARYQGWVSELGAPSYAKRLQAADRLAGAGRNALPLVVEATNSADREVATRAFEVLRRQADSDNEVLRREARAQLERLSTDPTHRFSTAAQRFLRPPEQTKNETVVVGPQNMRLRVAPARVNAFPGARVAGARFTQVRVVNGGKQVTVQDGKRTVIADVDSRGQIKLEVTETSDGKPQTKRYEAQNEADLQRTQPEGYAVYQTLLPIIQRKSNRDTRATSGAPANPQAPLLPMLPNLPPQNVAIPIR